jgi:hypothetical protein
VQNDDKIQPKPLFSKKRSVKKILITFLHGWVMVDVRLPLCKLCNVLPLFKPFVYQLLILMVKEVGFSILVRTRKIISHTPPLKNMVVDGKYKIS